MDRRSERLAVSRLDAADVAVVGVWCCVVLCDMVWCGVSEVLRAKAGRSREEVGFW
jgi:hypothetical protein